MFVWHATGLSTTTITNLISELLTLEMVAESGREVLAKRMPVSAASTAGRRRRSGSPRGAFAVGIHFGVDTLRAGVTDLFGNLSCYRVLSHATDTPAPHLLEQALGLVEAVIADGCVRRESLVGVGVGASGLVDPETGVNVLAPNLGWRDVPLRDIFSRRLGLPVFVDNNVPAMALAEAMFGAGRGVNTLAFSTGAWAWAPVSSSAEKCTGAARQAPARSATQH